MKPCTRNRKSLALLAANALDAPAAGKLREHITVCPGCREYFTELSSLTSRLSQPQDVSEIEASENFHQKLAGRIRVTNPLAGSATAYLRLLKWRILIPAAGIGVLAGIACGLFYNPISITRKTIVKPAITSEAGAEDLSPTFANYQNAANQSFDKLDSLLTRQAREGSPAVPIYTASATALAQGPL